MNIEAFARALGKGIESAVLIPYVDAKVMLKTGSGPFLTVEGASDSELVTVRVTAIQQLVDHLGECVEIVVIARDATKEMKAYFYSRPEIPDGN